MSYDIYFLRRRPGESFGEAMDRLEEAGGTPPASAEEQEKQEEQWHRVAARVREILGDVQELAGDGFWELTHEETGIQVSQFGAEVGLSVPYWSEGEQARRVVRQLYAVARAVAGETGLEAWDPQLEAPVTDDTAAEGQGAAVFDEVARNLAERSDDAGPQAEEPPPSRGRPRWQFWRHRAEDTRRADR